MTYFCQYVLKTAMMVLFDNYYIAHGCKNCMNIVCIFRLTTRGRFWNTLATPLSLCQLWLYSGLI